MQQVQDDASGLLVAYSGEKAQEIRLKEIEVLDAWKKLQFSVERRKNKLGDTSDLYRFFNLVRDLLLWMEDMIRQIDAQEKARDVSGVELLMNNHHSLKAEIEAREENITICVNLGKDLLARRHYRTPEVIHRQILSPAILMAQVFTSNKCLHFT